VLRVRYWGGGIETFSNVGFGKNFCGGPGGIIPPGGGLEAAAHQGFSFDFDFDFDFDFTAPQGGSRGAAPGF